jgi:hypothetical protein
VVLQMLRDGRITVDEAEALLDALAEPAEAPVGQADLEQGVRRAVESVGPALRSALRALRQHVRVQSGAQDAWAAGVSVTDEVRWSHPAPAGRVRVRNLRGDLVVEESPDGEVHVEVRKRAWGTSEPTAQQLLQEVRAVLQPRGEDLVVEVGPTPGRFTADLTLRVPAHTRLDAQVASGDVRVGQVASCELRVGAGDVDIRGASGPVVVRCGAGDVRLGTVEGDLSVEVGSGDLSAGRVVGSARVQVASGDVRLGSCSGAVAVRLQRGDLEVTADGAPSVRLEVSSGDVRTHLTSLPAGAVVEVHVASGDVELVVGPRVRAQVRAETQRGTVSWAGEAVSRRPGFAEGVVGAADATVSVRVGSGDVVVREGR